MLSEGVELRGWPSTSDKNSTSRTWVRWCWLKTIKLSPF